MPKVVQRKQPWDNHIVSRTVQKKISVEAAAKQLKASPKDVKQARAVKDAWDERVDGMILEAINISRGLRWGQ